MPNHKGMEGLSIEERLQVAAHFLRESGVPLTVSALCRHAGVNRSNIYDRYLSVLDRLGISVNPKQVKNPVKGQATPSRASPNYEKRYQVLAPI